MMDNTSKRWNKYGPQTKSQSRRGRYGQNVSHRARREKSNDRPNFYNSQPLFERRNRQRPRLPQVSKESKYHALAQFKMAPTILPENKPRPFMGLCCSKCLSKSKASISDPSVFTLSVYNILHLPFLPWGIVSSKCVHHILHIFKRNDSFSYPDVSEKVLTNDRFLQTTQILENDSESESSDIKNDTNFAQQNLYAKRILQNMKSSISSSLLRISSWIFHFALNQILEGVLVHKGDIEILKSISQDDIPLIFLPLHRSHLDYVLVSFVLYMNQLKVPLVAAGDNLNIPLFGYLMHSLGAFFIRRHLDSNNKKDHVYKTILKSYMTESLKEGHSLEFFIEGGRTRSGKPRMPKTGLLSFIVDAVLEGSLEDVYVTPVSISYEKIVEGNFVQEQLGRPKEKETFFTAICSIWKVCHSNFGNIRIDFGQPFSLKEFLQSAFKNNLQNKQINFDFPLSVDNSLSLITNLTQDENRKFLIRNVVKNLAKHVIYDSTCCTSLMSTQMLAFLLITQYRKGATQQQLQHSFDWLRMEVLKKQRDVGFTGESLAVIKRAVSYLGKDLIVQETVEMEWTSSDMENNNVKVVIYKPVIKLPHVLELQYYANSVVSVFLLDSIVVNALYALIDVEFCHFLHCDSKLYVLRDELVNKAIELCDLLQFEFVIVPPCADLSLYIYEVLEQLLAKECIHLVETHIASEKGARYSRIPNILSFESSDDEDICEFSSDRVQLKVDLNEDSISHLEFLRNILSPYIESYWLASSALLKLVHEIKEENLFIQDMQLLAQDKLYKGLLAFESFSATTFKNALKLFEHWHVIEHYVHDEIKIVYLHENYDSEEKINDVIAQIEDFRK